MFNLKVILLISCLIAVAVADPVEVTGDAKEKAVQDLTVALAKVAAQPNAPTYTFDTVDKVSTSGFGDTQLTYNVNLKKNGNAAKACIVYLTVAENFYDLIFKCQGDPAENITVHF